MIVSNTWFYTVDFSKKCFFLVSSDASVYEAGRPDMVHKITYKSNATSQYGATVGFEFNCWQCSSILRRVTSDPLWSRSQIVCVQGLKLSLTAPLHCSLDASVVLELIQQPTVRYIMTFSCIAHLSFRVTYSVSVLDDTLLGMKLPSANESLRPCSDIFIQRNTRNERVTSMVIDG